jgi:hypothetical protein
MGHHPIARQEQIRSTPTGSQQQGCHRGPGD